MATELSELIADVREHVSLFRQTSLQGSRGQPEPACRRADVEARARLVQHAAQLRHDLWRALELGHQFAGMSLEHAEQRGVGVGRRLRPGRSVEADAVVSSLEAPRAAEEALEIGRVGWRGASGVHARMYGSPN